MRTLLIPVLMLLLICCNNQQPDQVAGDDPLKPGEGVSRQDKRIWISAYDSSNGEFFLKKQRNFDADTLTAEGLVRDINTGWDNVTLVFDKIVNDTVYVSIPNSVYLTQQMGTAGADAYISSTTYTLTELTGIHFVRYDFEPGDHLTPGTFSRKDFEFYR